jgi:hypothetical protein
MASKIRFRRDTEENWNLINPVLQQGEPGYNLTNQKLKIGDGSLSWDELSYLETSASSVDWEDVTNKPELFSGDYQDLTNQPTIPTDISDLTDDTSLLNGLPEGTRFVNPPTSSSGTTGDQTGDISFSSSYIYYCTANYVQTQIELTSIASSGSTAGVIVFYGPDNVPPTDMSELSVIGPGNYIGVVTGPSIDQGGSMWHVPVSPDVIQETGTYTFGEAQSSIWKRIEWNSDNNW